MDRRTFMMTSAYLSTAAGSAWPWLVHAAARSNAVAVVDSTLAYGAAFAGYASHRQLPVFETGDDIGALWFTKLAPLLCATPTRTPARAPAPTPTPQSASLIGLTRASDYFVLSQLAKSAGQVIEYSREPSAGSDTQRAHVAFAFTFAPRALRKV
ncbi:hypothetical protein B0G75_11826 [Paraburkholderia sp. BL18I3N2]|uniref:hypothetical protein n=1 Tax=Paraburkholderia sp. BL18I3N2 TaxID=1938799 RepID=UPI000D0679BF|nr:hypothetical protein [Paraburkholderia sp. BL18I3N2]PRX26525.1 hypothetical protein B0G75_11826 [Paraburkholderia sp. BL18I3N2]